MSGGTFPTTRQLLMDAFTPWRSTSVRGTVATSPHAQASPRRQAASRSFIRAAWASSSVNGRRAASRWAESNERQQGGVGGRGLHAAEPRLEERRLGAGHRGQARQRGADGGVTPERHRAVGIAAPEAQPVGIPPEVEEKPVDRVRRGGNVRVPGGGPERPSVTVEQPDLPDPDLLRQSREQFPHRGRQAPDGRIASEGQGELAEARLEPRLEGAGLLAGGLPDRGGRLGEVGANAGVEGLVERARRPVAQPCQHARGHEHQQDEQPGEGPEGAHGPRIGPRRGPDVRSVSGVPPWRACGAGP